MYSKPTPDQITKLFDSLAAIQRDMQFCKMFLENHIVNGGSVSLAKDIYRLTGKIEKARIEFITVLQGSDNA